MRSLFLSVFLLASCHSPESTLLPPDPGWNRMIDQPRLDTYEALRSREGNRVARPKTPTGAVPYRSWTQTASARPMIDEALLRRGERQFSVYCAPCHGVFGQGETEVGKFMHTKPPGSLHSARARTMGSSELERIIAEGTGRMPGFAAQLDERSRWAAVAWVKLLQRSYASEGRRR